MINNQININRLFGLCRYVAVVFGIVFLSTWTVRSASLESLTQYKFQQDALKEITGVVKTEQGEPMFDVVVKLAGTNVETETDVEGRYKFNVKKGDKIQFIYKGYKTSMAIVRKSNILNIKMKKDDTDLPDITISFVCRSGTGYADVSAFSVKKDEGELRAKTVTTTPIIERVYTPLSFVHLLQAQMISLDFSKRYNSSERNSEVILKDVENLTRNGKYTYIVDGVRVSEETFHSLNQNDVESVDIYKHTDVYNARFGNKENQSRITLEAR